MLRATLFQYSQRSAYCCQKTMRDGQTDKQTDRHTHTHTHTLALLITVDVKMCTCVID